MSKNVSPSQFLESVKESVYRGPIERTCRWLGLHDALAYHYGRLRWRVSETVVTEVSENFARFRTETWTEYKRVESLMGEQRILEDILINLQPDDVFFDIGANIGVYTCFVGAQLSDGVVVAFEPHPENAARLVENARLNSIDVEVKQCALSDSTGTASLSFESEEPGVGTASLYGGGSTIEIEKITGDELVASKEIPSPTVLKIDVEGGELNVLRGLTETLSREDCRLVYCEVHPEKLPDGSVEDVIKEFQRHGFSVKRLEDRGGEFFLRAQHS